VTHAALCALYVALAVFATWPVARYAADHVVDGVKTSGQLGWLTQADIFLHTWILSWGVHALSTAPATLLDANIFHPSRWALARSEHDLGNLPLFAPVYLATGNPILAHQLAMVATYALSGAAVYLVVWRWCRRPGPAFVAGALFALTPAQLAQLAHIQVLSVCYLPLVFLATTEVLARGERRWTLALAAALVLQALCSVYLGAMAFVVALAAAGGRFLVRPAPSPRRLGPFAVALALAAALTVASFLPQALLAREGDIPSAGRPLQEAFSAKPLASYLPGIGGEGIAAPFLSVPVLLLALGAVALPARRLAAPTGVRAAALGVGIAGYLLSLGPTLHLGPLAVPLPFRLLALAPGLAALRAPNRFGILVALAASLLAGLALAGLGARARRLAAAAALAVLVVESRTAFPLRHVETGAAVPPVYRWLAEHGGGEPVLELPIGIDPANPGWIYVQSRYTYLSTYHWSPLLNGYSAYPPQSFFLLMAIARRLPDPAALQDLVDLSGLRWVVVHGTPRREAWQGAASAGLGPPVLFGEDAVYRVDVPPRIDLRPQLAWPEVQPTTLTGVPVTPLAPEAMRGILRDLQLPPRTPRGAPVEGRVTIENRSHETWPGFRADPNGLVHIGYRWLDAPAQTTPLTRVPVDLRPGDHVRLPFLVRAPGQPGRHRVRITLVQLGGAWFDESGGPSVDGVLEVTP
jgi:hypothetical protein